MENDVILIRIDQTNQRFENEQNFDAGLVLCIGDSGNQLILYQHM